MPVGNPSPLPGHFLISQQVDSGGFCSGLCCPHVPHTVLSRCVGGSSDARHKQGSGHSPTEGTGLARGNRSLSGGGRGQQNRKRRTIAVPVATAVSVFASWVGPAGQPSATKPRAHSPLSLCPSASPSEAWKTQQFTQGTAKTQSFIEV